MPKLLKLTHPSIHTEIDQSNNPGVDIDKVHTYSQKKINFVCQRGHQFTATPHNRVWNSTKFEGATGCTICNLRSRLTYDLEEKELHLQQYNGSKDTIYTRMQSGGECEESIYRILMKAKNKFQHIKLLSSFNGNADLEITMLDGVSRFIQVKKLTRSVCGKGYSSISYHVAGLNKYEDNMVIAMISIQDSKFCLGFAKDFTNASGEIHVTFTERAKKYKNNICVDETEFLNRLIDMIPHSVATNKMSAKNQKEFEMKERFKLYCERNGLQYRENENNFGPIDCYVNELRCQLKFVS